MIKGVPRVSSPAARRRDARVAHLGVSAEGERTLAAIVAERGAERRRLVDLLQELLAPDEP